ncbi:Cysteine dioxygenase [Phlyctochytrium bullatum]|nr:Cysteine dioxygenase [Phlyctochytrium bullatum]
MSPPPPLTEPIAIPSSRSSSLLHHHHSFHSLHSIHKDIDSSTDAPCSPSTTPSSTTPATLDDLVKALHVEMADKGIDQMDSVDVERVQRLMESYASNPQDWAQYAHFDPSGRKYTRNLVDDGNGKFNLMVLCWPQEQSSAIHDHAGSHCLMKVLGGEILETQYYWPHEVVDAGSPSSAPMKEKKATVHSVNRVAYIHDKIGLHRVSNPSPTRPAISLHLYCPPYDTCRTFCPSTSVSRGSGRCLFYSERGTIVNHLPASAVTCGAALANPVADFRGSDATLAGGEEEAGACGRVVKGEEGVGVRTMVV